MITLLIDNFNLEGQPETQLKTALSVGGTTVVSENTAGFSANDYYVADYGTEQAELRKISSITDATTWVSDAMGLAHDVGAALVRAPYNQAKIYSASSKNGTYTIVATVDLAYDQDRLLYEHSAGTVSTWYKVTYYNATTATETPIADAFPVRGGVEIVAQAGHSRANSYVSYEMASEYFNNRYGSAAWFDASTYEQGQALIEATRIIDAYRFHFQKCYQWQRLEFPRSSEGTYSGAVDSGTTTTLTDADFQKKNAYPIDYFRFYTIWFYDDSDTNYGGFYTVDEFNDQTGTFTIDTTFSTTPTDEAFTLIPKVPDEIRDATCETALAVIEELLVTQNISNIKRQRLGDEEVEYFDQGSQEIQIPLKARQLLNPYISFTGMTANTRFLR